MGKTIVMDKYKAIFFDADDTLVDHQECEREAFLYLFKSIGIDYKDEYQDIFRPLDRELWTCKSYKGVSLSIEDIPTYRFKLLFEKINLDFDDYSKANDLFMTGLANSTALLENAEEIVEYLHDKGYMLCVVTNGLVRLQKPRVMNSRIGKFISHIIVSEEVDAHKPNPLIFAALLERISINPKHVAMIGDSLEKDIQGAKNAGIKTTIWFNPLIRKNKTGILPDYEISSLLQMKDLF
jgi:YjjG family noncanonical pyrimidine nucleotidase